MNGPAERRLQSAFLSAVVGAPGVTQLAAAQKLGVDPSLLCRWMSGERALPFDSALWLVEWTGGAGLAAVGTALGLEIDVRRVAGRSSSDSAEVLLGHLAGHLGVQLGGIASTLRGLKGRPLRGADRVSLLADLARLEELVRLARLELSRHA